MYKLVIADDEKIIREGLKRFISRDEPAFEVVECFKDGKYVIEYLKENSVDVIITDIRMSNVSGIDVAKYVYDNNLKTKVVMISGYKEFDYAMKAIEYNVYDYLIKPTNFDKCHDVLQKIKKDLDKEKKLEEQRNHYEEILPALTEEFFADIIMGALKEKSDIIDRAKLLAVDLNPDKTKCILFEVKIEDYQDFVNSKWEHGKDRLNTMIKNIVNDDDQKGNYYQIYYRDDKVIILYVSNEFDDIGEIEEWVKGKLENAKEYLETAFSLDISSAIVCVCQDMFNLAKHANLFKTDNNALKQDAEASLSEEQLKLLITHIRSGHCDEVDNIFESFMNGLERLPVDEVQIKVKATFKIIYDIISETVPQIQNTRKSKMDYSAISECTSFDAVKRACKQVLYDLTKYVEQSNVDSTDIIIRNAKKFIDENYSLDISLQDVADQVFLSQKYFSKFFKEKTGENYLDYLIKVRMDHAIEFLAAGYKVEEISRATGYNSSRYFTRRFKQYTGYTPKEYYRRIIKGDNSGYKE